jgi:hypothetical protein
MGKIGKLPLPNQPHDLDHGNVGRLDERGARWEVAMHTQKSEQADRAISTAAATDGPLSVVCFSTYVSDPGRQEPRHRDVRNFLLALRGERIDGESRIPVGTEERALSATNANDSIDWFGEMVSHYLSENQLRRRVALVPVPTSRTTLDSSAGPWTSLLAISIASNGLEEADIVDVLRWRSPLPPPGQRSSTAAELFENLAVTRKLDPGVPVVLVDYLYASSATLRACAGRLRELGVPVPLAVCAGRTTDQAVHGAFTVVVGEISAFEPGH